MWKKYKSYFIEIIVVVAIVAGVMVFIKPVVVNGISMEPNLQDKNYILLSRQAYRLGQPKHGQIVVFPVASGELYIKRVIGVPGDTITIKDGKVYVNGKEENQSFTNDGYTIGSIDALRVPEGKIFVMGDNRQNSEDSRFDEVGMRNIKDVTGVALIRLWPLNEIGPLKQYR